MPRIRTVFQPGVQIDVPDDELEVLHALGLVHTPAPDAAPATEPEPAVEDRTKTPKPKTATGEQQPATADASADQKGK